MGYNMRNMFYKSVLQNDGICREMFAIKEFLNNLYEF